MNWLRIAWNVVYYPVRCTEFILAFFVLYLFIGALISLSFFRYDAHDAFLHSFFWPLAKTQWAQGFSESKMDEVKEGMTASEVKALLGDPLTKNVDSASGDTYWIYSWRQGIPCCNQYDGNFHRREIRFSSNDIVKSVRREFDAD